MEEQGASSSTASNGSCCHSNASAATVSAWRETRARFSRKRLSRPGERSTAVTLAPANASCAVLPPGAAHRSAIFMSRMSPNKCAGRAAAASCTHHAPSENPGSNETAPCASVRTVPVGSTRPRKRSAHDAASDFTVRSSAGSWPFAAAIARAESRPYVLVQRLSNHSGVSCETLIACAVAPSCATRRSTALTSPAYRDARRSACASRTERSTAAWSGTSSQRICAAPSNRMVSARGASDGNPFSRYPLTNSRSVPSRRNTVAVSRRINARSRSASEGRPGCAFLPDNISSSAIRRRRTPSRMSAAILRAARPGTSGWGEVRGRAIPR